MTLNTSVALSGLAVSLVLPMSPKTARFALGLGRKGGLLSTWFNSSKAGHTKSGGRKIPGFQDSRFKDAEEEENATVEWKWDGVNGNNALWLGNFDAGIRVFPKGKRHLNNQDLEHLEMIWEVLI